MRTITLIALTLFPLFSFGQHDRKVVVMNMNTINAETNDSRYLAAVRLMRLCGVPFDTTSQLDTAFTYPVMITGSRILNGTLSPTQANQIKNYVNNGGVLITSTMRDTALFNMCGISNETSTDQLFTLTFDTTFLPELYHDINDSLEVTISLGDTGSSSTFFTRYYGLSTATALATYETGSCALAYNAYGNGHVYTFGPDLRDITIRNQIDLDVNAHRTYSNGFEPTSDVVSFFVRNIVRKHIPRTAYKYTVPGNAQSVFMMTHDIDSDTGMDTMYMFSNYEATNGVPAQYNVTTRYTNDGWMTSFYVGSWSEVHALITNGHTLASHSVGHFPDFDNESNFPLGTFGNTPPLYQPFYTGGITTGGTVMGEVEVSKNLIQDDHSVPVRSFRAGHLAYNDSLAIGLMNMNYEFNSTHSANNVLSSFPFYDLNVRSFSGEESTILEIPMTISDVFNADPISPTNYTQKVAIWAKVCRKYHANHSPVVLLIHPNRTYKLNAEMMIVDSLPQGMIPYSFEKYGEYWRKRDSLQYHTEHTGDTLFVKMDNDLWTSDQSFVIDANGLDTVRFFHVSGVELPYQWENMSGGRRLYYYDLNNAIATEHKPISLKLYPNPTNGPLLLSSPTAVSQAQLVLTDLQGRMIQQYNWMGGSTYEIDVANLGLQSGTYLLLVTSGHSSGAFRVVYTDIH